MAARIAPEWTAFHDQVVELQNELIKNWNGTHVVVEEETRAGGAEGRPGGGAEEGVGEGGETRRGGTRRDEL